MFKKEQDVFQGQIQIQRRLLGDQGFEGMQKSLRDSCQEFALFAVEDMRGSDPQTSIWNR